MLSPSSWSDGSLSSIFTKTYTKPIATYYPYTSAIVTPVQPTSTPNRAGTHATSSSGTKSGLKTTVVVSICIGVTCISFIIWLLTRRLVRHRTLNKASQPDSIRENITPDNHHKIHIQGSDYMTFSNSGTYLADEKSSRPQTALPEKTCTEFTPITVQSQVDRSLVFELDSESSHYGQLEQGANSDKHFQTNASNCHPRSVRSHRAVLQRAVACPISRSVHRKQHLDAHKYSHRLRRFKTLQSNIKPDHRLRVHCQRLLDFPLFMGVLTDGGVFL